MSSLTRVGIWSILQIPTDNQCRYRKPKGRPMTDDAKRPTAPYGSWETTFNALQRFAEGVPPRVDRTAFPGLAWVAATRLLNGLRFLGLIDEEGRPQPMLSSVAIADEAARKYALGKILREQYAEAFKLDLARVTPAHLAETLGEAYNTKGDTREKAVRFFVAAATYAGIPLSPLLTREKGRKPSNGGAGRQRRRQFPPPNTKSIFRVPDEAPGTEPTRVVRLKSGGVLTLTAAVDFLTLSADDRKYVFDLIDKLSAYQQPEEGS